MPTPDFMRNTTFSIGRRGFDRAEVTELMVRAADRIEQLEASLQEVTTTRLEGVDVQAAQDQEFDRLAAELAATLKRANAMAVESRARAISAGKAEADTIRAAAEGEAADLLAEAEDEAADLLRAANDFVASVRREAVEAADEQLAAADTDRREAADLLCSARISATALAARSEERAKDILEQGKRDASERADGALAEVHELIDDLRAAEVEARRRMGQAHDALETALVAPAEWSESRAAHPAGGGRSGRPHLVAVNDE